MLVMKLFFRNEKLMSAVEVMHYNEISPEGLVGRFVELGAAHSSVLYDLVVLCGEFESSGLWKSLGVPTAAHWIGQQLDVEICTAREWIRVGKSLSELPYLEEAFRTKKLSYSKVRTLSRFANSLTDKELTKLAQDIPAGKLNHELARWSMKNEDQDAICERQQKNRGLFASIEPDGSLLATLKLSTANGTKLLAAVDARVMNRKNERLNTSADALSLCQQRADALVELVTTEGALVNTEILIHVRGDGASFDDGTPISESIVEKLAPEAFIRALIYDAQKNPVNASPRRRHPTTRQKRLVEARDKSCIDCGSNDFEQYDHDPPHYLTGHTTTDELFLRCSRCHRARHKAEAS